MITNGSVEAMTVAFTESPVIIDWVIAILYSILSRLNLKDDRSIDSANMLGKVCNISFNEQPFVKYTLFREAEGSMTSPLSIIGDKYGIAERALNNRSYV